MAIGVSKTGVTAGCENWGCLQVRAFTFISGIQAEWQHVCTTSNRKARKNTGKNFQRIKEQVK
jgi:hypothetical protein